MRAHRGLLRSSLSYKTPSIRATNLAAASRQVVVGHAPPTPAPTNKKWKRVATPHPTPPRHSCTHPLPQPPHEQHTSQSNPRADPQTLASELLSPRTERYQKRLHTVGHVRTLSRRTHYTSGTAASPPPYPGQRPRSVPSPGMAKNLSAASAFDLPILCRRGGSRHDVSSWPLRTATPPTQISDLPLQHTPPPSSHPHPSPAPRLSHPTEQAPWDRLLGRRRCRRQPRARRSSGARCRTSK